MCRVQDACGGWGVVEQARRTLGHCLNWIIPVDIMDLGPSLNVFAGQELSIHQLRLCHRFGDCRLSRLPQEILNLIIDHAHSMAMEKAQARWRADYECFRGRCDIAKHITAFDPVTDDIWNEIFEEDYHDEGRALDRYDFTPYERAEMVQKECEEQYENASDFDFDLLEPIFENHRIAEIDWVEQCCRCERPDTAAYPDGNFTELNNVLKRCFGLQAMIMHEEFSHSLSHFIPGPDTPWDDIRRSTSCFIGLSEHVWQTPLLAEKYAPNDGDWHLATHKIQRNPRYHLSPEQRTRFSKAMRTLKLRPYYNPINMKTDMQPCDEEDFWTAVCEPHNVCTDPSREPMGQKMRRLDDYIERKSQDLARQALPQYSLLTFVAVPA